MVAVGRALAVTATSVPCPDGLSNEFRICNGKFEQFKRLPIHAQMCYHFDDSDLSIDFAVPTRSQGDVKNAIIVPADRYIIHEDDRCTMIGDRSRGVNSV